MTTYGLLVFEDAEELDFVGPWEVFTASAAQRGEGDRAVLIAERTGPVRLEISGAVEGPISSPESCDGSRSPSRRSRRLIMVGVP